MSELIISGNNGSDPGPAQPENIVGDFRYEVWPQQVNQAALHNEIFPRLEAEGWQLLWGPLKVPGTMGRLATEPLPMLMFMFRRKKSCDLRTSDDKRCGY